MKSIFVLILMLISVPCFAQSWGTDSKSSDPGFFDGGNKTQVIVNENDAEKSMDSVTTKEAKYSFDVEGLGFFMPDQPAADQFVSTITGLGLTYKFSDLLHIPTKIVQMDVKGPHNTSWHHEHYLVGIGLRSYIFDKSQQIQLNLLTGSSSVKEKDLGEVENLEAPVFFDIKYYWLIGDNFAIGPQITFGRVANKCDQINGTYLECGHGGYTSVMLGFQAGIPDEWGK